MNLQDFRDQIGSLTKFQPDIDEDKAEIDDILNSILLELGVEKPWKFAQDSHTVVAEADKVYTGVSLSLAQSSITLPSPFTTSGDAGKILEISGSDGDDGEYVLFNRDSATLVYVLGLDGTTPSWSTATGVTVKIKQRYISLPQECSELLSVESRTYTTQGGKFCPLTMSQDEEWQLGLDQVGTPRQWVPAPEFWAPTPTTAPTLGTNTSSVVNPVPVTGTYYVCYTFRWQGMESGPSPVASISATAATTEINISAIQDTGANTGMRKRIYVKVPGYAAFYAADNADIDDNATTSGGPIVIPSTWPFGVPGRRPRLPEHGGNYKRIRLHPRPSADTEMTLRYLRRPRMLIEDTDVPQLPAANHRLLLFRAVEECLNRHESPQLAAVWGKKAEAQYLKMKNRELNNAAIEVVKGNAFGDDPCGPRSRTLTYEAP